MGPWNFNKTNGSSFFSEGFKVWSKRFNLRKNMLLEHWRWFDAPCHLGTGRSVAINAEACAGVGAGIRSAGASAGAASASLGWLASASDSSLGDRCSLSDGLREIF